MYNIVAILIVLALNIASSVTFAQEFTFKPPPNPSPSIATKAPAYTAEDYANSSNKAYQEHQAKIAAIASQQAKEAQMNKAAALAKQPPGTPGKTPSSQEQVIKAPQKTMIPEAPTTAPKNPAPTEAPPTPSPAVQPYTGFQSPPSTPSSSGSGSTTPNNSNQNSGGWGSSIKY